MIKNSSFAWNETIQAMLVDHQPTQANNTPTLILEFNLRSPRLEEQLHDQGLRLNLSPYQRRSLQKLVDSYIYLTSNEFMDVIGSDLSIFGRMKNLIASYCVPLNGNSKESELEAVDVISES